MNSVFVIGATRKPLMPCRPARARQLLSAGKAAACRRAPITLILKDRAEGDAQPVEFKVDPGGKTTGIALVGHVERRGARCLFGANAANRVLRMAHASPTGSTTQCVRSAAARYWARDSA